MNLLQSSLVILYSDFVVSLEADEYYEFTIDFREGSEKARVVIFWELPFLIPKEVILTTYYYCPEHVLIYPIQITEEWLIEYTGLDTSSTYKWAPEWGDGLRLEGEVWDDDNTANGDGYSATCDSVETDYYFVGGSHATPDVCTLCPAAGDLAVILNPGAEVWGDGIKVGTEQWDDGNTVGGDGCSSDWTIIEADYIWDGGDPITADIWITCESDNQPDSSVYPPVCSPIWGDAKKMPGDVYDDGNTKSGDGWKSDCTQVESDYICNLDLVETKQERKLKKTVMMGTWKMEMDVARREE